VIYIYLHLKLAILLCTVISFTTFYVFRHSTLHSISETFTCIFHYLHFHASLCHTLNVLLHYLVKLLICSNTMQIWKKVKTECINCACTEYNLFSLVIYYNDLLITLFFAFCQIFFETAHILFKQA